MLAEEGLNKIVIGHLSHENNHPDVAYKTVASHLTNNGFTIGESVELYVARRDVTSKVFNV